MEMNAAGKESSEKDRSIDRAAFMKYLCALLLFGSNGIVASHIALNSYEIVFLRTMIGSALLIILFLMGGGRFHLKENRRDALFIILYGMAMGTSWMFVYHYLARIPPLLKRRDESPKQTVIIFNKNLIAEVSSAFLETQ